MESRQLQIIVVGRCTAAIIAAEDEGNMFANAAAVVLVYSTTMPNENDNNFDLRDFNFVSTFR